MPEFVTYITVGNKPGALRDYLVKQHGMTAERATTILDGEPYKPTSREDQYHWVCRVLAKVKAT